MLEGNATKHQILHKVYIFAMQAHQLTWIGHRLSLCGLSCEIKNNHQGYVIDEDTLVLLWQLIALCCVDVCMMKNGLIVREQFRRWYVEKPDHHIGHNSRGVCTKHDYELLGKCLTYKEGASLALHTSNPLWRDCGQGSQNQALLPCPVFVENIGTTTSCLVWTTCRK